MDPVIPLVIAFSLAALWIAAAAWKLRAFSEFSTVLKAYRLVPEATTNIYAVVVIGAELGLGIGLLVPAVRIPALAGSAALLAIYAGAIAMNLYRGRRFIDCGCMGPTTRQPLSHWLVSRNLTLTLTALAGLLPVQGRELVWFDAFSIAAAVGAAVLLYGTVNHLIANAPDLARLRS